MISTVPADINDFDLANARYAIVESINSEDSSYTSIVQPVTTSYQKGKSDVSKPKKLSSLSGLFDFKKLDEAYFEERGI